MMFSREEARDNGMKMQVNAQIFKGQNKQINKKVQMCLAQRADARETDTETQRGIMCVSVHRGTCPGRRGRRNGKGPSSQMLIRK